MRSPDLAADLHELPLISLELPLISRDLPGGQGMLWTALLPTETAGRRFATLELMPAQMTARITHAWFDYRRWAYMNGAEYFALVQPDAPSCGALDFRQCGNISARPAQVLAALREVLQHTSTVGIGTSADGAALSAAPTPSLYEASNVREMRLGVARRTARWDVVPGMEPRLECINSRHWWTERREAAAPKTVRVDGEEGKFIRACALIWMPIKAAVAARS